MATYRVLYWQEIPAQVKAEDDADEVNPPLDPSFAARIDAQATRRGLSGADEYLAQWHWGEEQECDGTAEEVAHAVRTRLEAGETEV